MTQDVFNTPALDLRSVFNDYPIDLSIPIDMTATSIPTDVLNTVDLNETLTVGRYKMTIKGSTGVTELFAPQETAVDVIDPEFAETISKRVYVESVRSERINDENYLFVTVDIRENPIPVFVVYAAVALILIAAAAISTNSVLVSVERVLDKPASWGIILIFLAPLLLPLINKFLSDE